MVVIEGESTACDDYIHWLKNRTGNWKALALRGEITEELRGGATLAGKRRLPAEFRELAENDMGMLGQLCAECGLEGEFKSFIMQHRAGASEPQSEPEPAGGEGAFELVVIVFHHLLAGKAHTKEMEVLAAAKARGLRGVVVYGTPGIVALLQPAGGDGNDEKEFLATARKIGKKGDVTARFQCDADALQGAAKGGGKRVGLWAVELGELKQAAEQLGAGQDEMRAMLGVA